MTYLLINPYPFERRNGVTSYLRNLLEFLHRRGIEVVCMSNDDRLPWRRYQERVRDMVTTRFRPDAAFIEAPEVGSPTLLLPPEYRVHIRLHCPTALVQRHNGRSVNLEQFGDELRVIRAAHVVSSPSHALLTELAPHLDVSPIHVYKNPPPGGVASSNPRRKEHDVVFMGNFTRAKGADFLNPLLTRLPPRYSVLLVGRYSDGFEVSPGVHCSVTVRDHIAGPERLRLLAETRVVLMLSRFENCSMLVLECLRVGTIVAGWEVGGHAEIAGPSLIRLVPLGDLDALASVVVTSVEGVYPSRDAFRAATGLVMEDFRRGWSRVWATGRGRAPEGIYHGLDCRLSKPPEDSTSPRPAPALPRGDGLSLRAETPAHHAVRGGDR